MPSNKLDQLFLFAPSPLRTSTAPIVARDHKLPIAAYSASDPPTLPRFQDVNTCSKTPSARHQ